jgi:hypothetical protein
MVRRSFWVPGVRKFGILFISISIILSLMYPLFHDRVFRLVQLFLSSDHRISPDGQREFGAVFYFGMVMVFCLGFALFEAQDVFWRARIKRIFLEEPLCRYAIVQPTPRLILFISSLVGFLLIVSMRLAYRFTSIYPFLYRKDHGLMDLLVPLTVTVSAILLSMAVWKIWHDPALSKYQIFLSLAFVSLIFLLIVYAGEEVSWGQDFFAWNTPAAFSGNLEDQTNIHNYFNSYFDYGYMALSILPVIILASAWLEFKRYLTPYNRLILPHPSLLGLGLLIGFVAVVWFHEEELLEEMMAAFVLFYSLRIYRCFHSGKLSLDFH